MWLCSMQYSRGPTPCQLAVFPRISSWQVPIEGRRGGWLSALFPCSYDWGWSSDSTIAMLLCSAMMLWLELILCSSHYHAAMLCYDAMAKAGSLLLPLSCCSAVL